MDRKVFFLVIILINQFCFSQSKTLSKIDNLGTESEVQSFIRSCSKSKEDYLSEFELKTIQSFDESHYDIPEQLKKAADSLGVTKSFYKGDFDHNGKNDLLFIGDNKSCQGFSPNLKETFSCNSSVNIIFDLGKSYHLQSLKFQQHHFVVPIPIKINDKDYIKVIIQDNPHDSDTAQYGIAFDILSKILMYRFNNFLEYNPQPANHSIQQIIYETEMCYGFCPIFKLELNKTGNSKFYADSYNFIDSKNPKSIRKAIGKIQKDNKNFETLIHENDFLELENLLNYIDFENLKDDYAVTWTDDQTSVLKIIYDNGKVKTIKDYGLSGTYGLKLLYQKLFDLRFNQDWRKIK